MALIEVKDLRKVYSNEAVDTVAVDGVSLTIEAGEFVSIMGPSGSGKSTLMHMLGLLERPTSGSYWFYGKEVSGFSDDELALARNESIGFVFQAFNLLPKTSVYDNVELPLFYAQTKVREPEEKVKNALASVNLSHRMLSLSNQLSGGEKQRVAIARALVNDPKIVFADEPTGNLDSQSGRQVMGILQTLNQKGVTIILVTHETQTAKHGTRMLQMKDGKIISDSPITDRVFADQEAELVK
jgi:putative ABC transport system ATP-binding protein